VSTAHILQDTAQVPDVVVKGVDATRLLMTGPAATLDVMQSGVNPVFMSLGLAWNQDVVVVQAIWH
jgi:hypothetical protein